MTHPPDSGNSQTHTTRFFFFAYHSSSSTTTTPKPKTLKCRARKLQLSWQELGHLATGDYSPCPTALGTHQRWHQRRVHVLAGGHPRIYWDPTNRGLSARRRCDCACGSFIQEPALKAHATQCLSWVSRTRAAHINHLVLFFSPWVNK